MHIFENIWVRSEMVPIQGSDRKAKVYIPTFWGRLAWWVMPVDFICFLQPGDLFRRKLLVPFGGCDTGCLILPFRQPVIKT